MCRDVFISYSSEDEQVATKVCTYLESQGVTCWIAPRDITPGEDFAPKLLDAIDASSVLLLILSGSSNMSQFVQAEINHAFSKGKSVFALRVEDILPSRRLALYLNQRQWLDGFPPPIERKLDLLVSAIRSLIGNGPNPNQPISVQNQGAGSMLHAFVLPMFLIAWANTGKIQGALQTSVEECCEHLTIPFDRLRDATNPAGVIEDPSLVDHFSNVCKQYMLVGTAVAQACGTLCLRESITAAGADWRQMLRTAARRARQYAFGLFPAPIVTSLAEAFAIRGPEECLKALQQWVQMAEDTL